MLGKQLCTTSFQGNGMNEISLPMISAGVYIIKLKTTSGMLCKKVIIE